MFRIITLFLYFLHATSGDWITEWMSPIQEQMKTPTRRTNDAPTDDENNSKMVHVVESTEKNQDEAVKDIERSQFKTESSIGELKSKLEETLHNAKVLAITLNEQIKQVSMRENMLKEAIVNGRSGVSTALVSPIDRPARSYIIRDGIWSLCRGTVRVPEAAPSADKYINGGPKCFGDEIVSQQDPCVFNSVIKYETLPTVRRLEYTEDDFLCLKQSFNTTLERYMSVPRKIINETCHNGVVRSLEDNNAKCGIRVMSEYSFYPFRGYGTGLPLDYCTEPDGSCKLIMGWHVSNSSIENFEFLKDEQGFKKYFVKSGGYLEHLI